MINEMSIYEIIEFSNNGGEVICFGAGKAFERFLAAFSEFDLSNHIDAVVDNDVNLWGEKKIVNGKIFDIKSPNECIEKAESILIIITCQYLSEITKQLKRFWSISNNIIFYGFIIDDYCDYLLDSGYMKADIVKKRTQIPKVIHYCWFGKNKIPDIYKEWMQSWKKFCPDYEVVEWNENNYDITKNRYMYEAYEKKKWGFVPDYARLDIIYQYGGIYLDTDVEIIKSLDELLNQDGFAGFQDWQYVALGLGFGAISGNYMIKKMRDYYNDLRFVDDNGKNNLTPSPIYQTNCLKEYGLVQNGTFQNLPALTVYPKVFFSPKNYYTGNLRMNENTFMIHHFDGSWVENREKNEYHKYKEIYDKINKKC